MYIRGKNIQYNEILSSLKKKCSSDVCYGWDEPWRHCAKWSKPDTKVQTLQTPLVGGVWSRPSHRDRKEITGHQGLGVGDGDCLRGTEFHLGSIKKFWIWMVMVTKQCKCTGCCWAVRLKMTEMANTVSCVFYHSETVAGRPLLYPQAKTQSCVWRSS